MRDGLFLAGVVVVGSLVATLALCALSSALDRLRRRREQAWFRAVLDRGVDFIDRPSPDSARFLAEAARRRSEERAGKLKEAAE